MTKHGQPIWMVEYRMGDKDKDKFTNLQCALVPADFPEVAIDVLRDELGRDTGEDVEIESVSLKKSFDYIIT